jgi:hypothetical protein
MKDATGLTERTVLLALMAVIAATGTAACNIPDADNTGVVAYKLTHSTADAEYILSWDTIVSRCPDLGAYDKQELFIRRGESRQSGTGTTRIEMDSPAAWGSTRLVETLPAAEEIRGFGVWITYCEIDEYLDELLLTQTSGFPVQEDGEFVTGVVETKTSPMESVQLLLAGKHFAVLIMETASSGESLFFNKDKLMEFIPGMKSRIASIGITPLPSDIPEREMAEGGPYEWYEFETFNSEELSPPIRVPEGQHYNDLIFSERPLMQVFNFIMDKDWRFAMTAEGEAETRFEVYITVTSMGEGGISYSTDHFFTLHSASITIIREEPLEERYTPPVDIEIKVYFDRPMGWVMKIEK